jgi:hypothetical protein
MSEALVRAFVNNTLADLGSPFTGELLRRVGQDIAADGPFAVVTAPWADLRGRALHQGAVPIRLAGALHDLALEGAEPEVTAGYPAANPETDWAGLWPALASAAERHGARLTAFMGHEPQTNEVRRSAALLGGFLTVAARTGLPLRTFELGASAGLNQSWDRFAYRLGEVAWGDPESPLTIPTEWRGPPPPLAASVHVLARRACDRRPTDLSSPGQRRRLTAYIWADQIDRLERLERAISIALACGVHVEEADAAAWTEAHAAPEPGAATVVYHSVFWQYLPPETQARLSAALQASGERATAAAPFAWLRLEPPPEDVSDMRILLTLWPGGETRQLGRAHPHGAWIEWAGA